MNLFFGFLQLSILTIALVFSGFDFSSAQAELGILLGTTYTLPAASANPTYTTSGALGFPLVGISASGASFINASLSTHLDYSPFKSKVTPAGGNAATSSLGILNWLSFIDLHFKKLSVGIGGGLGYRQSSGSHSGFSWISLSAVYDISRMFSLQLRPMWNAANTSIFESTYVTFGIVMRPFPN